MKTILLCNCQELSIKNKRLLKTERKQIKYFIIVLFKKCHELEILCHRIKSCNVSTHIISHEEQ